jgi:hypothetical protein
LDGGTFVKHFTFFLVAVATMAGLVALIAPAPGHAGGEPAPFVTETPHGYRDWRWISSAHEAGKLNSLGALLGNDVAFNAFREGKLPFPDGTILAALHYRNVPSDENNKIIYEKLLPLPREGQSDRPCLYSLCTLMLETRAERNEATAIRRSDRVVCL